MIYKDYYRVMSEAQGAFCDYVYKIADKMNNNVVVHDHEWTRVILLWMFFHQGITLRYANTDLQLNRCLDKIEELSNINNFPFVPIPSSISPVPDLVQGSLQLLVGPQGPAGDDANIVIDEDAVQLDDYQVKVSETTVGGVKTYLLTLNKYLAPTVGLSVAVPDGRVAIEVGESEQVSVNRTAIANDPNYPITSSVYTAPSSDPDITSETLDSFLTNAVLKTSPAVLTFTTEVSDAKAAYPASDTITWRYPILYGHDASATPNLYTGSDMNKLLDGSNNVRTYGDTIIAYDADDMYFFFTYPEDYPDLTAIYDAVAGGDNVISGFQKDVVSVTSTGLDSNFTKNYKRYRTILKTSIHTSYLFVFGS